MVCVIIASKTIMLGDITTSYDKQFKGTELFLMHRRNIYGHKAGAATPTSGWFPSTNR